MNIQVNLYQISDGHNETSFSRVDKGRDFGGVLNTYLGVT